MGVATIGTSETIKRELVTHYRTMTRFVEGSRFAVHHATVVRTLQGHTWLIEAMPGEGVGVKPAEKEDPYDPRWRISAWHSSNLVTVEQAVLAAKGRTQNPTINYLTSGTCILSARRIKNYLNWEREALI